MSNSPCYECEKRCMLCHAHCNEYAEWVQEQRERTRRPQGERDADAVLATQAKRARLASQTKWQERNKR